MKCQSKDCVFRKNISGGIAVCDYAGATGRLRNCPVEDCDKYVSRRKSSEKPMQEMPQDWGR